jgi:hypothetical protein
MLEEVATVSGQPFFLRELANFVNYLRDESYIISVI